MIVKEDITIWFQKLESYKRIDIMCTLLNLCLPFELRFLGTCLEELGRRDDQVLRGIELRVNNPQDFTNDVGSFQTGQPTDIKIRRKMALYLGLMRACNRTGVTELFKTLDRWGERDFSTFSDGDPLQELLLVYTMATNHPVFSFEQRNKCGEIYNKITASKSHLNQQSPATTSPITTPLTSSTFSMHQLQTTSPPPFSSGSFQQPVPQLINPQLPTPILMAYPTNTAMTPIISTADPNTSLTMSVESLPSHPIPMMPIPADFTTPPPWNLRYQPQIAYSMVPLDNTQYPPQPTSPHLSQPSSPSHSRAGSPSRLQHQPPQVQQSSSHAQPQMMQNPVVVASQMQTQPPHRNRSLRNSRPSTETTPPPLLTQQSAHQQQGSGTIYMGNDHIMVQTIKSLEDLNMEGAMSQLQSLRNGYTRPPNTIPRQNTKQQNWAAMHANPPVAAMNYTMHMVDPSVLPTNQRKTTVTGSDSGGSSTGEASPPPIQPDPAAGLHGNANQTQSSGSLRNKQPLNLSRLNGGKHGAGGGPSVSGANNNNNNNVDFNNGGQPAGVGGAQLVTSNSSGNLPMLIGPMHNFSTAYRTSIPPQPQQQQPPQRQFQLGQQPNGEVLYATFGAPYLTAQTPIGVTTVPQRASPSAVAVPTPYPTNKMVQSCFNCGSTTHTGLNCSEASMEDVTRNAVYKLDYTASATSPQFMTPAHMTTSTSSLNPAMSPNPSVNNNETDQSITFIDLTQDTTSSSSSSIDGGGTK